ncbi:hypothetical protein CONCODRAFT_68759 [Conidiobolus coronatus NRRL 28638]|uniref:Uncharacterized protein n=1 Tax=Conidiobolus coronatus (strain ATCC 28846 / CBS 209.66 / NRRL 28638) TaxID=796925 RepID=A0A137PCW1_CONC2|nr:hypothetical protein CONCODRAFT_68759 [Conidiobolus coronatus NRRL 28638]|eukprot:KXN72837.1 hypothetical protein CONCODRAFT_68759 [Conidiobolus coronatus NRRL 28638]
MNCLKISKLTSTTKFVTTPSLIKFNNFSKFTKNLNQTKEYGYLSEFKQFLDNKDNNDKLIIKLKSSSETTSTGKINDIREVKVGKLRDLLNSNQFNNDDYRFKLENSDNSTLFYKSGVLNDLMGEIKEVGKNKDAKLEDIQNGKNQFEAEKRLNKE